MDYSLPGSSVHGRRTLEWVAIFFSRDLPDPGIKPPSPVLAAGFFTTGPPGKPIFLLTKPNIQRFTFVFQREIILQMRFSAVSQSCPTVCNPMNRSTPGLPVHNQLPEFTQTHAHRVGDAIQPSHPLSSPSAANPSQHQGLFQCVNCSHEVAKILEFSASASVLPMNTWDWSPLGRTGWIKWDYYSTKYQFFICTYIHIHT